MIEKRFAPISALLPTINRGHWVLQTVHCLRELSVVPTEIIVLDQSTELEPEHAEQLRELDEAGAIRWIKLSQPSQPAALNHGLRICTQPLALCLDDDIIPDDGLITAHWQCHQHADRWAVSGVVLQPGETIDGQQRQYTTAGFGNGLDYPFNGNQGGPVASCMSGNLSVKVKAIHSLGEFDERYLGSAFRFDTDMARRIWRGGGQVWFEPQALIHHLRAPMGGIRGEEGDGFNRRSIRPGYSMGDYLFVLKEGLNRESTSYALRRPFKLIKSRFHAKHPWFIPVKLLGEARAMKLALMTYRQANGPDQKTGAEQVNKKNSGSEN